MLASQEMRARRPYRIFVVDDDPALTGLLTDALRLEGCTVVSAVDGLHALQFLTQGFRPDVILLDIHMEGADGLDFFASLQQLGLRVPIIVMTGDTNAAQLATEVRAASYLKKPFGIDQLLQIVELVAAQTLDESGPGS